MVGCIWLFGGFHCLHSLADIIELEALQNILGSLEEMILVILEQLLFLGILNIF